MLRGGDAKTLPMIKKIADLLVFAAYHLKLEAHLILDQCSYNRRPLEDSPAVAGDQKEILPEESDKAHLCARLVAPFESRILSVSPFVHFPPPVQLSKMVTFEAKLYGDRMQLDESADAAQAELLQHTVDKLVEANQLFTDAIRQGDLQSFRLFGDYPLAIKNGLNYLVEHSHTIISPFSHQNIMVLYSNLCTVTALPCHPPEIHVIEYYRETDLTLGQYLEELCFDSSYICPSSSCQRSMLLHCRAYVHGTAQLSVLIEEFPAPISGMEATILMWSLCK